MTRRARVLASLTALLITATVLAVGAGGTGCV